MAPVSAARFVFIFVAFVASLLFSAASEAAPFDPGGADWEGYADFARLVRAEVGKGRFVVTNHLEWRALTGDDALVLVYPEHAVAMASAGAFVRAGGRLALIDDFGAGDALLESFDITRVSLPPRPALALRDNPDLAIAEPGKDEHTLTQGVDRVVTNHASGVVQPLLQTVLRVRATDGTEVPIALAGSSGEGRLLAIGDPSILMNSMLRYGGNRTFAKNLIDYLTTGHARGRIYLVVSSFVESGAFPGAGGAAAEWRDALDQARASLQREGLPPATIYWLAIVVMVAVFSWLVPRTTRTYRGRPPRFTWPIRLDSQGGAAGRAASMGARGAYRGHAMIEWRNAFVEDLAVHFGLGRDAGVRAVVERVKRLGVVDREAMHSLERVLLRMAEIDTMLASKQPHVLERIGDDEVVAAGALVMRVLSAVQRGEHGT